LDGEIAVKATIVLVCALLTASGGLCAEELQWTRPTLERAFEVVTAPERFVGRDAAVMCRLERFDAALGSCAVSSKLGRTIGFIHVRTQDLQVVDRERAINKCGGWEPVESCWVEIVGVLDHRNGLVSITPAVLGWVE
jgi:hypothetical protein